MWLSLDDSGIYKRVFYRLIDLDYKYKFFNLKTLDYSFMLLSRSSPKFAFIAGILDILVLDKNFRTARDGMDKIMSDCSYDLQNSSALLLSLY